MNGTFLILKLPEECSGIFFILVLASFFIKQLYWKISKYNWANF